MQTAIEIAKVDHQLVVRLNQAWTKRATVCAPDKAEVSEAFDPARPDYPRVHGAVFPSSEVPGPER